MLTAEQAQEADLETAALPAWREWKRLCALGRCSRATQVALQTFAVRRFRTMVGRYRSRTGAGDALPRAAGVTREEAWHLFETHMVVGVRRCGKRYKDWLFARLQKSGDDPLDVIQGGATLIMRDVVRDYLRAECSQQDTVSLDVKVDCGDGPPVTLIDLMPAGVDIVSQAAGREYAELASRHADETLAATTYAERMVLLARSLGVSLASHHVGSLTGRRKTRLYAVYRRFVENLATHLKGVYQDDDTQSVMLLTWLTINHVKERIVAWARHQDECVTLFSLAEDSDVGAETA